MSFLLDTDQLASNATIMQGDGNGNTPELTWVNVAIASSFILVNGITSLALGLKLEKSLLIASIRCLVQLTIMGYILEDVFKARHPAIVMLMTCVLILLGTYETVYNKSKQTYRGMFLSVLFATGFSTLLIGIVGSRWAMEQNPFWVPETFIPTMGMLLGNMMSGMAVGLSNCLSSVSSRKEHIEAYLAMGASRWEAGRSIAIEAVRMAMLPTINQMSVIGLISIPGMMTGQILGGAPVMNAVRYQQIIMFLISASTALGVLIAVISCIRVMIDSRDRLRPERIDNSRPSLFRDLKEQIVRFAHFMAYAMCCCGMMNRKKNNEPEGVEEDNAQRQPLLQ